jgi:hypothetical protein
MIPKPNLTAAALNVEGTPEPTCYVSGSGNAYRVIVQGMPATIDYMTIAQAVRAYHLAFRDKPNVRNPAVSPVLWNSAALKYRDLFIEELFSA